MDFRRLEMIFIAIFIALDIYLAVALLQNRQSVLTNNVTQTSQTQQALKDMQTDKITLGKLDNKKPSGYYLASRVNDQTRLESLSKNLTDQTIHYDEQHHILTSEFKKALAVKKADMVETLTTFMANGNNVLLGDQYEYDADLSSDTQVVFVQKVPGGVILDDIGQLIFKLENNQIVGYTQTYINNPVVLREKQKIKVGAKDAVVELYIDNEIPENSRIKWIKLGYTPLLNAKGSTIYIPAWYVAIENKSSKNTTIKRLNAFTRALMKTHNEIQ